MIKFNEDINCHTCKYGYFERLSESGNHNLCGKGNCYLCAAQYGECDDYEKGVPPEGKEEM